TAGFWCPKTSRCQTTSRIATCWRASFWSSSRCPSTTRWSIFARHTRSSDRTLDRNHDLAHLGVRLEILVGFHRLRKRERFRNRRLKASILQAFEDIAHCGAKPRGVASNFAKGIPAHAQTLCQRHRQGKGCRLPREEAAFEDHTAARGRARE